MQKYNCLLVEGLANHPGVDVIAVCTFSVSRSVSSKLLFSAKPTVENGVMYEMVSSVNIPILRNVTEFLGTFLRIWRITRQSQHCVIVADSLNIATTWAVMFNKFIMRTKVVGVILDLPSYTYWRIPKLKLALIKMYLNRFSAYLLITNEINYVINKQNRPHVIIEGFSDSKMVYRENLLQEKYPERVCMYTGILSRVFGVGMLVEAFLLADISGVVLQFYGNGDYEQELAELTKKHKNIRYGGTLPSDKVVEEQIKAMLLINPRPTAPVYTKYSFPSKNMEYLASGTPLLTTKLPGMPDDHLPYVYLFEEETVEGYAKTLREVLSLPAEDLHAKGLEAKDFAMRNKNNVTQAGKLLDMIKRVCIL